MSKKRWKITVEYDGTDYCGWQRQAGGLKTVQGEIEAAITKFCGQEIGLHVAGRTDTGVHAKGQIAHFDLDYGDRELSGFELAKAINAHLRPNRISVLGAQQVGEEFHARFNAKNKLYRYRILLRHAAPTFERNQIWHIQKALDVDAMREGAQHVLGHHDFSTFRASQCQAKNPMRSIDSIEVTSHERPNMGGTEINISVEGRSFLHHQVRNIVGTLTLVGEGKWTPQDVKTALEAKDRTKGGPTAPACGLYLIHIDYPQNKPE